MRLKWITLLFGCCLMLSQLFIRPERAADAATIKVNESNTRLLLEDKQTKVSLSLENSSQASVNARLSLELLDTHDRVRAHVEQAASVEQGASNLLIPLPIQSVDTDDEGRNQLLWYRLRYRISPASATDSVNTSEGIISLSEITPDIFELRVVAPSYARGGLFYRVRARAAHPITARPVKGVNVHAEISFYEDAVLKSDATTDKEGWATLDFNLPRDRFGDDAEIKVTARRGVFVQKAEQGIELDHNAFILLSTDKPLYQPGQTLRLRALLFDPSKHALAETAASVEVSDPQGENVFRSDMKSSRFGVASASWKIPEDTPLGDYHIEVKVDDDRFGDSEGEATVKISRYDLPNFTVNVKPDHPFYLPGQNAEVEVRADYLFGQQVKRGHVRVVRETERTWNYKEQKWETKEGEKFEGETDGAGRFIAHINLAAEHKELADEDYSRFHDLTYAAYFTDPTTNRTEQRRFDLRLTKDAIHIYVHEANNRQSKDFPLNFYVSTFYADGTPAECEVTMTGVGSSDNSIAASQRKIKTNRYGVAKVSNFSLPTEDSSSSSASVNFQVRDGKGGFGHHTESFWLSERPVIHVETDKTIYRPGEPVRVWITASEPEMRILVDAAQNWKVIHSESVRLHKGRATVTLPYDENFKDEVTIAAYSVSESDLSYYNYPLGTHTIIYPRDRDLKLDVHLGQTTYRPGEQAHADFRVRTPQGRGTESALGVVIFDKAVEERARTDREFGGGGYGFYRAYSYLSGNAAEFAGITRKDLDRIDLSKPIPPELDLVAEVILSKSWYRPELFGSSEYEEDQQRVFANLIASKFYPVKDALVARYGKTREYPRDVPTLQRILAESGINLDNVRDPWGTPYQTRFLIERQLDVIEFVSAGADKIAGTDDDFVAWRTGWPYFLLTGEMIERALKQHHARTLLYIRDYATLKSELLREAFDLDSLRDRWGHPYRFEFAVSETFFTIKLESAGPDGIFSKAEDSTSDDFTIWTAPIDYFAEAREKIDATLARNLKLTGHFPQNEAELREALKRAGFDLEAQRDGWGRSYYTTFTNDYRYADNYTIQTYSVFNQAQRREEVTPVNQIISVIFIRSNGADGKQGTPDDFNAANFSRIVAEQRGKDEKPQQTSSSAVTLSGATGAIMGTVTDPVGGAVPGATVKATNIATSLEYETKTDDEGRYVLRNLPAGIYVLRIGGVAGFSDFVMDQVPVRSSQLTKVNASLQVAGVSATVTVTSDKVESVDPTASKLQINITQREIEQLPKGTNSSSALKAKQAMMQAQISTPRLREYFPETLLWQPELQTDSKGRAQLQFKLADNITTWKMSVIGSTEDGEIGTAEREIQAFQPFFVEHDPPRILTEGDEISLPVVLRNYLNKQQPVDLEIKPETWFSLAGPARKHTAVEAGDSVRETFEMRTVASVKDGKQHITAIGTEASDAIERPVTVHPDGEEIAQTASEIIDDAAQLEIKIPAEAIRGSLRAELKVYPNLLMHVAESIEGIMERPHGCGEQTISSTYPSLLFLRSYKHNKNDSPLAHKAERYLRAGYERLQNYRAPGGGFSYWGHGEEADLALSAYALRFLSDAKDLMPVDDDLIAQTRDWLIKQQRADGSWAAHYYWSKEEDRRHTAMLTSYIARVLSTLERKAAASRAGSSTATASSSSSPTGQKQTATAQESLRRALAFLAVRIDEADEPYLIASYALAAQDAGEAAGAERAVGKLRTLAHEENGGSYWSLETNTPFYGWGRAGRVETTAIVLQALAQSSEKTDEVLVHRGLLFLLREKDRYGVWYSTQATINVLDALITLLSKDESPASSSNAAVASSATPTGAQANNSLEIIINGRHATDLALPPADKLSGPLSVDLSAFLSPGANHLEFRRAGARAQATAQLVSTYYIPWSVSTAMKESNTKLGHASGLRLSAKFDKTEAKVRDEVTCTVEAERTGSAGYGMLLAEIGLPPGAEVDRASLERAMSGSDWSLMQYDILPDRLVVYLWPRAGGTRFDFKFRPRFGLTAQTAPSLIYDYYNPESRAVVTPVKFTVR